MQSYCFSTISVWIYNIFLALHYLCWFTALLIQNDACIAAMLKLKIVINQTDGCLAWVDTRTPRISIVNAHARFVTEEFDLIL